MQPITANTIGRAQQRVNPPVWARYQHGAHGRMDQAGGGAEIHCTYNLHVDIANMRPVMAVFETNVPKNEMWHFRL